MWEMYFAMLTESGDTSDKNAQQDLKISSVLKISIFQYSPNLTSDMERPYANYSWSIFHYCDENNDFTAWRQSRASAFPYNEISALFMITLKWIKIWSSHFVCRCAISAWPCLWIILLTSSCLKVGQTFKIQNCHNFVNSSTHWLERSSKCRKYFGLSAYYTQLPVTLQTQSSHGIQNFVS